MGLWKLLKVTLCDAYDLRLKSTMGESTLIYHFFRPRQGRKKRKPIPYIEEVDLLISAK